MFRKYVLTQTLKCLQWSTWTDELSTDLAAPDKRKNDMAWIVMCNLTQQELGRFASRDEALESPEWESTPEPLLVEGAGEASSEKEAVFKDGQNLAGRPNDGGLSSTRKAWIAIYAAATVAAAEAIKARDWAAKRQFLAVAEQAEANGGGRGADGALMTALFGCSTPPAQYARFAEVGATIAPEQVTAALAVIKADAPAKKGRTPTARDMALRAAADERREKARAEAEASLARRRAYEQTRQAETAREWAAINAAAWAAAGKEMT